MFNRIFKPLALLLIGLLVPLSAFAQTAPAATTAPATTQTALGEVSNFGEFISLVWSYGSQVLLALAVFFILLGAFFYVASAGNDDRISQGKQMIFGSFIAILIVIFSGVLIRTLHKPAEGTTGYLTDIPTVIGRASAILTGAIAGFSALMLVYASLLYILARGDEEKIRKSHAAFRYALLGLLIGLIAYGAVDMVVRYLL